MQNNPKIVVTDGYHITKPLKLVYKDLHTYCFKVGCAISDRQLLFGFILLAGLYLAGMFSGMIELKVLSFVPLIYLLVSYYLNRKEFIRLVPVLN
ncbi:MAG TPA: hypothetical protein VGO58_02095 [Chitinophagaceae bacterium]|jgi:hypothetical protein|nr:hypothetical protein [Chitinophagaceae bacterium]